VHTAGQVLDLAEEIIGSSRPLVPKVQFLIEELFPSDGGGADGGPTPPTPPG